MRRLRQSLYALAAWAAFAAPATALTVIALPHEGRWDCTLDGRAVTITWQYDIGGRQECSGNYCTNIPTVDVVGWFRETARGGDWRRFDAHDYDYRAKRVRFDFRGDPWELRPGADRDRLEGHSTWRGRRFPLSCTRAVPVASSQTFAAPRVGAHRLDLCRVWASECGLPAADQFCRDRGFWRAESYSPDWNIGATRPTVTIGAGQICDRGFCDGFSRVACNGQK